VTTELGQQANKISKLIAMNVVVKKKNPLLCFLFFFRCFLWLNDTSYTKCLKGQKRICLVACQEDAVTTFSPVHQPRKPQCTASQSDGQPDRRVKRMTAVS